VGRDRLQLALLGTRVTIEGDAGEIGPLRVVFDRFEVDDDAPADLTFQVDVGHVRIHAAAREESYALAGSERVFGLVYARLVDEATRRAPGLICVHGAAVARAGRGVVLAAPSRHGKSTLALALGSRGWTFLSDEVAPIDWRRGRLLPFPMAAGCRTGTRRLLGEPAGFEARPGPRKLLLHPVSSGRERAQPVALGAVVFIESRAEPPADRRRFRLSIEPRRADLVAQLSSIDGVLSARAEREGRALVLELDPGAWVAPAVERTLAEHGVLVTEVRDLDLPRPDYTARPRRERLGAANGVLGLLRHLRGFGAVTELAAQGVGFAGLVGELAAALRGVGFYRLSPGRLDEMIESVESLVPVSRPRAAGPSPG
jgi:hypothetical protein